jgi:hypothetical protein
MKITTQWLAGYMYLLMLLGCGQARSESSPSLSLDALPEGHLALQGSRGETGSGDVGLLVTVKVTYDVSGGFCGTLRSPEATLGGVRLGLLSAGAKRVDSDLNTVCDFPTFQTQFGLTVPQGPLEVTDGVTTARLEYDALDPGTAMLLAPTDGILHAGESARWQLSLPQGHGLINYSVFSDLTVNAWAQGTSTPAGGEIVAPLPTSLATGTGSLVLSWLLDARVTACPPVFTCDVSSSAMTGFDLTVRP